MIDTHAFPSKGGWVFRQSQTGWVNPMALVGFKASVDAIRNHRLANPAIASKHKLSTDPAKIEQELIAFQQARGALPKTAPTFFSQARSLLPARVVDAAGEIRIAAQGTAVILDWIQSGGDPVAQELADQRAATCVACPQNVQGAWYTVAPAELLRSAIKGWQQLRNNPFPFETKQGDALKSCAVCKCLMRLKTFVPLEHIVSHTPPEIMGKFPANCWIARRDK
jgi:hypothetical protein